MTESQSAANSHIIELLLAGIATVASLALTATSYVVYSDLESTATKAEATVALAASLQTENRLQNATLDQMRHDQAVMAQTISDLMGRVIRLETKVGVDK
jgi:hypothetical protein